MKKIIKNFLGITALEEKFVELETRLKLIELLITKQATEVVRINELLSILVMVHPQLRAKKSFDDLTSNEQSEELISKIEKLNKGELN